MLDGYYLEDIEYPDRHSYALSNYAKNPISFLDVWKYANDAKTNEYRPISLQPFEKNMINHIHNNLYTIIIKSREMYADTNILRYALWNMIFKPDFKVVYLAPSGEMAMHHLNQLRRNFKYIPDKLKPEAESCQIGNRLSLTNGSFIHVGSGNNNTFGRGEAINLLLISEAAYINQLDQIWTAKSPQIFAKGGKAVLFSTPSYTDTHFYKMYKDSKTNNNNFSLFTMGWWINENYQDPKWYHEKCKQLGFDQKLIDMELNLKFVERTPPKTIIKTLRIDQDFNDQIDARLRELNTNFTDYMKFLIKKDLFE